MLKEPIHFCVHLSDLDVQCKWLPENAMKTTEHWNNLKSGLKF